MHLPPDSTRSRVLWSVPAALIILLWAYGVLAAGAVSYPDYYTPAQTVAAIAEEPGSALWPGEYARGSNPVYWTFQVAPWLAAALWPLCLVRWKTRAARTLILFVALTPAWFIAFVPSFLIVGPIEGAIALIHGMSGREYQAGGPMAAGAALWCWMLIPLAIATALRRAHPPGHCPACGYDLTGVPGPRCPECGGTV